MVDDRDGLLTRLGGQETLTLTKGEIQALVKSFDALTDLVCKCRDETGVLLFRAMKAELAAAKANLVAKAIEAELAAVKSELLAKASEV